MSVAEPGAIGSTAWYDGLRTRSAAALQSVREAAYGVGGYVGQDSFMTADQILALARATGVTAGARVLDVCCGRGGPALELVRRTGCRIVGVDLSREGLRRARSLARTRGVESSAAFVVGAADRLPCTGPFDAVMLLETMLAVARRLADGLRARRDAIGAEVGAAVCSELIAAHEHGANWLVSGRVRKLTIVLERVG